MKIKVFLIVLTPFLVLALILGILWASGLLEIWMAWDLATRARILEWIQGV